MAKINTYVVYFPGVAAGYPKILKITSDKTEAVEAAEKFVLGNGLPCKLLTGLNVECVEDFPKKEKPNG